MTTRGRDESEWGTSPMLRLLAEAMPFRAVRRGREMVGCWFTGRPRLVPGLHVFCNGMVRTADGTVAGVAELLEVGPDMDAKMLQLLSDASRRKLPEGRRRAASDFVGSVRHASEVVGTAWTPERERYELQNLRILDGYRGWRFDADPDEAMRAVRVLSDSRHRVLSRFLDTLDQGLVSALRPHPDDGEHTDEHDALIGDTWSLLGADTTTKPKVRDRALHFLDDFYVLQEILHPFVAWSEDREGIDELLREERGQERMRRFLPEEPSDLSHLPDPGFG